MTDCALLDQIFFLHATENKYKCVALLIFLYVRRKRVTFLVFIVLMINLKIYRVSHTCQEYTEASYKTENLQSLKNMDFLLKVKKKIKEAQLNFFTSTYLSLLSLMFEFKRSCNMLTFFLQPKQTLRQYEFINLLRFNLVYFISFKSS